jgi:hypothetical protein
MNWFLSLFRSKWIRTGKEVLGEWPALYVHEKTKASKLLIQHFTPRNYIWAMRRAKVLAFLLFFAWCWLGHVLVTACQRDHTTIKPISGSILVVSAIISLYLPSFVTHKRMQRHPSRGPTLRVLRIKKGILRAPGRNRTTIAEFHSAHHAEHPKARNEERAQALSQIRDVQRGGRFTARAYLYRDSSCVQVHAGHRGSRNLCSIEFYNDPHGEFAGLVSAAIDYMVVLARDEEDRIASSAPATGRTHTKRVVSRVI